MVERIEQNIGAMKREACLDEFCGNGGHTTKSLEPTKPRSRLPHAHNDLHALEDDGRESNRKQPPVAEHR